MIGRRIREYRQGREIKIADFAKQIGISQGSLSDIENEKTKPSAETISSIVRNTDIDATWLLTGEPKHPPPAAAKPDRFTEKIVLMLEGMTDEQKEKVRQYAEDQKRLADLEAAAAGGGKPKRRGAA